LKLIANNSFKIISGKYRGRKCNFPDVDGLRPTTGKVRETLFNWIAFESHNKTYLDLFSGSGALSFEALSRGAKKVISIEKNSSAFKSLEKNRKIFGSNRIEIINHDSLKYLSTKSDRSFDFVFLDPPFNQNIINKVLKLLSLGSYINSGSKVYIESEYKVLESDVSELFLEKINIIKQKKSGQVHYCLIEIL